MCDKLRFQVIVQSNRYDCPQHTGVVPHDPLRLESPPDQECIPKFNG